MLIDSHCHLTDKKFAGEVDNVIKRANEVGVTKLICLSSSWRDAERVSELVIKNDDVFGMVGVHPEEAEKVKDTQELIDRLKMLIKKNNKIVGIGEIGLDKYWNDRNLKQQESVFRAQLELALELGVPVAIHNRLAETEMRQVLDSYQELPAGVMHCFSGSEDWLNYVLERGLYVGFAGNVTYKNGEKLSPLQYLAKKVPLEKLLLETDAPYLSPEGKRGTRNESANVKITAEFLAELKGIMFEELAIQTTKNARRLFKIQSDSSTSLGMT